MELLDERWTMLVVRELVAGSRKFNDLRRGLPRMSPTLLSKRLNQLSRAGVVERQVVGSEVHYLLTPAGQELRPVVEALGAWGTRWIGHLGDEDLDPNLLMWDIHRNIDHTATPKARTVVHFSFPDVPAKSRRWWLVIADNDVDVCDTDPGHAIDTAITIDLRNMIRVWRGDLSWSDALRCGVMSVDGPERMRRAVPGWFRLSPFAAVPRVHDAPRALDGR